MGSLSGVHKVHMVGIGGIGMSAIAQLLHHMGKKVSGSDIKRSKVIDKLEALGIDIKLGHRAENIRDAQLIIYSSAINEDNPELKEAKRRGVPILHRAEALAELLKGKRVIAVTGSSGKTTTTAMIGHVMRALGEEVTLVVGGWLKRHDTNVLIGNSEIVVVEADESDASLLHLTPEAVVVSSITPDVNLNASAFKKLGADSERILNALRDVMLDFMSRAKYLVIGSSLKDLIGNLGSGKHIVSFGFDNAHWTLSEVRLRGLTATAIVLHNGRRVTELSLNLPGYHNLLNALATLALLSNWYTPQSIASALSTFEPPMRRFEVLGEVNGALIVDDYAHNPEKISALLNSTKLSFPDRRLVIVFQPHRYTRTLLFYDVLPDALSKADVLIFTPIYSAGEPPIEGVNSERLYERYLRRYPERTAYLVNSLDEALQLLQSILKPRDLVITVGAGNIREVALKLVSHQKRSPSEHSCRLEAILAEDRS